MIYTIEYSKEADRTLRKWKKSNPQLFKKYQKLYHELADHPRTGIGHPEPLIGGKGVTYSLMELFSKVPKQGEKTLSFFMITKQVQMYYHWLPLT